MDQKLLPPSERSVERQLLEELLELKRRGLTTRAPDILPIEASTLHKQSSMGLCGSTQMGTWELRFEGNGDVIKLALDLDGRELWFVELHVAKEWQHYKERNYGTDVIHARPNRYGY